jgi:hypothetical protein
VKITAARGGNRRLGVQAPGELEHALVGLRSSLVAPGISPELTGRLKSSPALRTLVSNSALGSSRAR